MRDSVCCDVGCGECLALGRSDPGGFLTVGWDSGGRGCFDKWPAPQENVCARAQLLSVLLNWGRVVLLKLGGLGLSESHQSPLHRAKKRRR